MTRNRIKRFLRWFAIEVIRPCWFKNCTHRADKAVKLQGYPICQYHVTMIGALNALSPLLKYLKDD